MSAFVCCGRVYIALEGLAFDRSGLLQTKVKGFGLTYELIFRCFALHGCCFMVFAKFSWFWPVQDSCGCVWIVVVGSIWLLMILFVVRLFWLFPYCSSRFMPDLSIHFLSSGLFRFCLMDIASSRWFMPVQNSCCGFRMFVVCFIWLLVIL